MTQEQKAKAYDEALERAKKVRRYSSDLADIKRMEDIFPELAESEDEKIRKALIRFHKSTIDINGIKGDEIVSWLENLGQVKESEISQPIKETSKENDNSLTIQNGIILDGVVYELTEDFHNNALFVCRNCELHEKCRELTDETLCDFFGANESRKLFHKVMESKS